LNRIHELLQTGDLDASMQEAMQAVRDDAGNTKHRVLLFQLQCLVGEWEKARRQLYVLKDMDASTIPMFETYDPVIQCEMFRAGVFEGERSPLFFGEPREWLATLNSALSADKRGEEQRGAELRDEAFEDAPATPGLIDDKAFEWIADADGRLGPVLEVFLNGRYYWVPFEHISVLDMDEPEDLRDLVWTPARFQWSNGGDAVGFIPTRYPGTEASEDDRLRMSRMTAWLGDDNEDSLARGLGQRLMVTDEGDFPLLSIRKIRLGAAAEEAEAGTDEDSSWPS